MSYDKQTNSVNIQQPMTSETKRQFSYHQLKSKSVNDMQEIKKRQNNLKKQKALENLNQEFDNFSQFQSAKVETSSVNIYFEDDDTMYYSALDLFSNKQINKISSTMINLESFNSEQDLFDSNLVNSPPAIQRTISSSSFQTVTDEFEFTKYQSHGYNTSEINHNSSLFLQTTQNSINNQGFLNNEMLYVCIEPYESKVQGDLSLNYADRVNLIHSFHFNMSLVQNISTKQCGYVPNKSIILLSNFLNH